MKQVVVLFFLVFLIGVSHASRFVVAGVINNGRDAFIASSKDDPLSPFTDNKVNNIFGFAVGDGLPLSGGNVNTPPFAAMLAAKGYIDYTTKSSFSYTDFDGLAAAFAFLYFGIGEYCEGNGVPGFQENTADTIIQFRNYTQTTFLPLTYYINSSTGTYGVQLTESTGLFTLKCRANANDRVDSGITISAFAVKCDVILNATLFWSTTTNCSDSNRYIGLLAYLASAAADTTDLNSNPDADGQNAFYDQTKSTFFKFVNKVEIVDILQDHNITASLLSVTENFTLPNVIKDIRRVIFSFLSPKSNNGNIYLWDPQIGVDPSIFGNASCMTKSLWIIIAMAIMALRYL